MMAITTSNSISVNPRCRRASPSGMGGTSRWSRLPKITSSFISQMQPTAPSQNVITPLATAGQHPKPGGTPRYRRRLDGQATGPLRPEQAGVCESAVTPGLQSSVRSSTPSCSLPEVPNRLRHARPSHNAAVCRPPQLQCGERRPEGSTAVGVSGERLGSHGVKLILWSKNLVKEKGWPDSPFTLCLGGRSAGTAPETHPLSEVILAVRWGGNYRAREWAVFWETNAATRRLASEISA